MEIISARASAQDTLNKGFKAILDYQTNSVYLGRTDTMREQVLIPSLSFKAPFGLFFTASASLFPDRKVGKLDEESFEFGYLASVGEAFELSISWTKLFFAATSTQISSSISSTSNVTLNYDVGTAFLASLSVNYDKAVRKEKSDVLINPTFSYNYSENDIMNGLLEVTPSFSINIGTQNFYDGYFTKKLGRRNAVYNSRIDQYRASLSKFSFLDFELSAPIVYSLGSLSLRATPTAALPANRLPRQITDGQVNKRVYLYGDFGIGYKF